MRPKPFLVWMIAALIVGQQTVVVRAARQDYAHTDALPHAGSVYVDMRRNARLLRITDESDALSADVIATTSFNSDATRFVASLDGVATLYGFDAAGMSALKDGPLFDREALDGGSLQWSADRADTLFKLDTAEGVIRLIAYDMATRRSQVVKDFSAQIKRGEVGLLVKSQVSDERFAFAWREAGQSGWQFLTVWDRAGDSVYTYDLSDPAAGVADFASARFNESAEALVIKGATSRVWRFATESAHDTVQLEPEAAASASAQRAARDVMSAATEAANTWPRERLSRDGRFALFSAGSNGARRDVFIAELLPAATATMAWTNLVNSSSQGNRVQKTGGVNGTDDASATSLQSVANGDAYVEFTAIDTDKERVCGLSNSNAIHSSAGDINFAIKLNSARKAFVVENGVVKTKVKYKPNNLFRVAIESNVVHYYKNGGLIYTSEARPAYPMLVTASLVSVMSSVDNAMVFGAGLAPVVSLSPASATLDVGRSVQFRALITSAEIMGMTWSADSGTITNTGLYTAPATAGTYTVRATLVADTPAAATATVTVKPTSTTPAPVITLLSTGSLTTSGATVSWTTDKAADTQVEYGAAASYGSSTALNSAQATSHSAALAGLSAGTIYHFRVKSRGTAGSLVVSGDQTFMTASLISGGGTGGGGVDPLKTDKNVYSEPAPPALPAAGGTLVDPVFGTTIMRVTDERDGSSNTNSYSYWPSLNRNSTRLVVFTNNGNPTLYDFDPVNFRISNKRALFLNPLPTGGLPWTEDIIWSGTDPDVIYCHLGLKVYAYNVASNSYTLVKDFTGQAPGANLFQMAKSLDDNAFGFTLKDANWNVIGYMGWQRAQNNLYTAQTTAVDEVQVDKSGQYLYVLTGDQSSASAINGKVVNLQTKQVVNLTDGAPDFSPGHKDCGQGTVVGSDHWNNSLNIRPLANPHQLTTVLGWGNDWSQSNHISFLGDNEGWLLVSMFVANSLPSTGLFKNELYLVSTDGTQRVRRVAHHHSLYRDYWDTPRADLSRDGQFAIFTSNWGSTTRRDVFIVKIPPASGGGSDTSAPVVSAIAGANVTATGATLNWTTNEVSDTQVEYGTSANYGSSTALNSTPATSHSASLSGLAANTAYHFRVKSRDAAGNLAASGDMLFTTPSATAGSGSGGGGGGGGGGGTPQNVVWTGMVNCTASGNSLQK
ncbi:MAG: fibronectin type III domain-containing protein, partial [Blastocatellia bacterium]